MRDALSLHRRRDSCIVDLLAAHLMSEDQTFPFVIDCRRIGNESKELFDFLDLSACLLMSEAQTILIGAARGDVAKFDDVLRNDANIVTVYHQYLDGSLRRRVHWVLRLGEP